METSTNIIPSILVWLRNVQNFAIRTSLPFLLACGNSEVKDNNVISIIDADGQNLTPGAENADDDVIIESSNVDGLIVQKTYSSYLYLYNTDSGQDIQIGSFELGAISCTFTFDQRNGNCTVDFDASQIPENVQTDQQFIFTFSIGTPVNVVGARELTNNLNGALADIESGVSYRFAVAIQSGQNTLQFQLPEGLVQSAPSGTPVYFLFGLENEPGLQTTNLITGQEESYSG
jgi:hypothetical protein